MDIEELAADMRPARRFNDPTGLEQSVEAGVSVGVQHAGEACKVSPRVLALAIRRVEEQCGRRPGTAKRPLITNVSPDPPGLGFAAARRQYWHRRVVAMKCL